MTHEWLAKSVNQELARSLSRELSISLLLAELLVARKINDLKSARSFLTPSLQSLVDPNMFAGMDQAITRIVSAINHREHIGIFGDYDVDGVCSTAMLAQFFSQLGASFTTTLPNRLNEGYGLSIAGIDRLKLAGASLIISADCGVNAHEQIAYANKLSLDVIVIDHHQLSATLPPALAVVNPQRPDCKSGASYLCAAGVCFFVCLAIRRELRLQGFFSIHKEPNLKALLDLAALATVCDVVPLLGHNRIIVKAGLTMIKRGERIGLSALINTCGIDTQKISSTNLGFHLGPRINAAGRLEDATIAQQLLCSEDPKLALELAMHLNDTNQERKDIEQRTVEHAVDMIEAIKDWQKLPALVLHEESWHPGVVGIVASRIAERFHRPAIIIGAQGKGSGRSIKGIDLHAMVSQVSSSLAGFGGHAHAIGLSLGPLGVDSFREELCDFMHANIEPGIFKKTISYDSELTLSEINLALVDQLAQLEPFGAANPCPLIRINNCFIRNLRRLQGGHLKGEFENNSGSISFIGFRLNISDDLVSVPLDILAHIERNEWQGRLSVQLRLIDYRSSKI